MIVPFEPVHAAELADNIQAGQQGTVVANADAMAAGICAWTCLDKSHSAVAAAGILEVWPGRGIAWALIGEDAGPHMCEITRAAIEALDACPLRRVELYVEPEFRAALRWARILGFTFEAVLEEANPRGGNMAIFKRIKEKPHGQA